MRLLTPWEELSNFSEELTADIDNLSAHEHGHLPWLVILLHFLEKWKKEHGTLPALYKEKTAFRATVAAGARTNNPEGVEENFDEAVAAVLKTVSAPTVSSSVKAVFDYKPNKVSTSLS